MLRHRTARRRPLRLMLDALEDRMLPSGSWVPLGPAPVTNAGNAQGINLQVGAVQAIAPDPNNANRVFIGAVNGGIWETTDATNASPTWTPLTDNMPTLAIGDLAMSPLDTNTLFAGTGSFSNGFLAPPGIFVSQGGPALGVLKTTDGGATWSLLGTSTFQGLSIRSIVPTTLNNGQDVLAGTFSDPQFNPTALGDGVFRSADGGTTWARISDAPGSGLPGDGVPDIVRDPGDPTGQRFYAALAGKGIFKSVDGGLTWAPVNTGITPAVIATSGNIRLSVQSIGATDRLYAGFVNAPGQANTGQPSGIFFTSDQGASWTSIGVPADADGGIDQGSQGSINFNIVADPTNLGVIFAIGDRQPDNLPSASGATSFTARDARFDGNAWTILETNQTNGTGPHPDSRDIKFDASGNILESNDGGIYRLVNPDNVAGTTRQWQSMLGNLQTSEFYSVSYDSVNNIIFGGTQDNGSPEELAANGVTYTDASGGDGNVTAVDNTSIPGDSIHYLSAQNLQGFHRETFNSSDQLVSDVTVGQAGLIAGDIPQVTRYTLDSVNPTRMLVGGIANIYESFNQGDTFTAITKIPANVDTLNINAPVAVNALVYGGVHNGVKNPDLAYIGTADGQLLVRVQAGAAFSRLTAYNGGPITSIATDPDDWHRLYVTAGDGHVFETTDAGTTFVDITDNLATLSPGTALSLAVVNPTGTSTDEQLLVGGLGGVYETTNPGRGSTWSLLGTGLPNVAVSQVIVDTTRDLAIVGTYGRGIWELSNVLSPPVATSLAFEANPAATVAGQTIPDFKVDVLDQFGHLFNSTASVTVQATGPGNFTAGQVSVSAVGGVATFTGLVLQKAGSYTLTVSATGLNSGSANVAISPQGPKQLAFASPPTNTVADGIIAPFTVDVDDQFGNLISTSTASVTVSAAGPGNFTAGQATQIAVGGVATFTGLVLQAAGNYNFTAAATNLTTTPPAPVTISVAGATKLAFNVNPADTVAGQALPDFSVTVTDGFGNPVTTSSVAVTIVANGPGGFSAGTTTENAVSGVATFTGLILQKAGSYTFTVSASGLVPKTSATPTVISPDKPKQLAFEISPVDTDAGSAIPDFTVAVEDQFDNIVTGSTLAVTIAPNGPGGFTAGQATANAVAGVATFTGLKIQKAGTYTFTASAAGVSPQVTGNVTIRPVNPNRLVFATNPVSTSAGRPIPDFQVEVFDQYQNLCPNAVLSVNIAVAGPGNFVAGSTTAQAAEGGVADFSGLVLQQAGAYTFTVSATGLASASVPNVAITPAAPDHLVFKSTPTTASAGATLSDVEVDVDDRFGNLAATSSTAVTVSAGPPGDLAGNTSTEALNGVALFHGLALTKAGTATLTAAAAGVIPATSNAVTIQPGAATQLAFLAAPSSAQGGQVLSQVQVQLLDAEGNRVTQAGVPVQLGFARGQVAGVIQQTDANGVATFTNVAVPFGGNNSITASTAGLTDATSALAVTGTAARLKFILLPRGAHSGHLLKAFTIQLLDALGLPLSQAGIEITISLAHGRLLGVLQRATNSRGSATFSGLRLASAGTITLRATLKGTSITLSTKVSVP